MFLYIGSHSDHAVLGTLFCVIIFIQLFTFLLLWASTVHFHDIKKIISLAFCFPNDLPQPSLVLSKPVQLWIVSWQCLSHYFNLWEVFLHMPVLGEGGCFFILLQAAPVGTEKLLKECMIWWEHTGEHKEK